jgi:DNA-binding MarR family transcriptional regulator
MTAESSRSPAFEDLIDETTALFHLLHAVAAQLHGGGELTAGRRGVLRGLDRFGPQTVPQMARARPVSRQYIQTLVNELESEGLVETIENPAHRRSRLVRLTSRGKDALTEMYRREANLFATLDLPISDDEMHQSASVLRSARTALLDAQVRRERIGATGEEASHQSPRDQQHQEERHAQ